MNFAVTRNLLGQSQKRWCQDIVLFYKIISMFSEKRQTKTEKATLTGYYESNQSLQQREHHISDIGQMA